MSAATRTARILLADDEDRLPSASVVVDGVEVWDVVTNGHAIIGRRVDAPTYPMTAKATERYPRFMRKPPGASAKVSMAELRGVIGDAEAEYVDRCRDCNGTGSRSDRDGGCLCASCVCAQCEMGVETIYPDARWAFLFGVPVNLNLVATALDALGLANVGDVHAFAVAENGATSLRLMGDDFRWSATTMSGRVDDGRAPRYFDDLPFKTREVQT